MARPTLFGHRKLRKLARAIGSEALAIGHLELIWHAANETGNAVLGDAEDVEALACWTGEPGQLVAALIGCGSAGGPGLIDARDDGRYEIHDYWHHCPAYVRKRAAREAERQAKDKPSTSQPSVLDETLTSQHRPNGRTPTPTPAPAPAPAPSKKISVDKSPAAGHGKPKLNGIASEFENQVIAAYHELLPDFPRVKVWSKKRSQTFNACLREQLKRGKQADTLEYWQKFFTIVADSDFLCGRSSKPSDWPGPDLEWLIQPQNFIKVIEGRYDNRQRAHG